MILRLSLNWRWTTGRSVRFLMFAGVLLSSPRATAQDRASDGLLVLYDFTEGNGQTVHDRSGSGPSLDLTIEKSAGVKWSNGVLTVDASASIVSPKPAKKIIDAVMKSNAISIEAWLKPANDSQSGPARIISLSTDTSGRNVTLGQDKNAFDVRLRATGSDKNGIPSTASPAKSAQPRLTHVVFTRDSAGAAIIYVDGKPVANKKVSGDFSNWDNSYRLALANEITNDRPWLGELHLVAIYSRALSTKDVQQHFSAGVKSRPVVPASESVVTVGNNAFETQIAPLLAKHCLECHDSAIKKGGLDLSRKDAALAGGESGKVIVPGQAAKSLLWESVSSGEMPKDRAPLSSDEKAALKKWLDGDAGWSLKQIDPAIYLHEGHVGEVWVQRLTVPEYIQTVQSAVGVDIAKEAKEILPLDLRTDGFSNTAYNLNIDLKHVEAYNRLAEIVVSRMDVLKFSEKFSKSQKLSTDDTMRDHVAAMGKWLLRGPLDNREINKYSGIATTVASAGGGFKEAMSYIVEAMLQSPRFVYRMESQRGDGTAQPVNEWELASRISYILWGGPPDEELLRAAEKGELTDHKSIEAQIQRMLKDPRTISQSERFVSEWLNLDNLTDLRPNKTDFPNWDAQLATDMQQETLAYFREVAWTQNRPLADLLNAQVTFATPRLARHYGLTPQGKEMARYDLADVPGRGGLLTQGTVLTIGGDDASMVSRGLFVLHDLLRGTVNAPPPCVNTTPPPTKAGLTQRGIAEGRMANNNCGVCHTRFEPLAFGLERFDGVGAWHEKDQHGNPLREDGEVLVPGEAKPVAYKTSAELMNLLAGTQRVQESFTWKVTQFALGRPLIAADAPVVAEIHKAAQKNGGTYSSLITAIMMSDLVLKSRTEVDRK